MTTKVVTVALREFLARKDLTSLRVALESEQPADHANVIAELSSEEGWAVLDQMELAKQATINRWTALSLLLLPLLLSLFPVLAPGPAAWAAGGAQIVDDSEVVDPGTCQLETWMTGFDIAGGGGYANATNTCTLSSLPRLEFGLQFQHYWYADILGSEQLLGPALKVNLIPEEKGVGLGLAFNGGVNMATGEFELGTLIMPVSIPLNDKARINLNAGWQFIRTAESQNGFFYGAQIESKIGWEEVSLMLEVFGREPGFTGAQMGLRWRPNDGPIEFDLLAGTFLDTVNAKFFTVGITFRY